MLAMGGAGVWLRNAPRTPHTPAAVATFPVSHLRRGGAGSAGLLPADWRQHGVRIAGAFIVVLGLITLARGLLPLSAHMTH